MHTTKRTGTYGNSKIPCNILTFHSVIEDDVTWYCIAGTNTVYATFHAIHDGIDLGRVCDLERIQSARPMNNERDLQSLMRNI